MKPIVSIVIPSYNEANIRNTIDNLISQTVIKEGIGEIIIVDYDPDNSKVVFNEIQGYPEVKYNRIFSKGISHARAIGCRRAKGEYIVSFDADSLFDTIYAVEYLIEPLKKDPTIVYTFCDNIPITDDALSLVVYNQLNTIQRTSPFNSIFESGFTVRKKAMLEVGGFRPDITMWECLDLTTKLVLCYSIFCKKHVDKCRVLTSDRRISKLKSEGLGILDYTNKAYR